MSYLKKAVTRITLDLSMPDVQKSITCTRGDRNRLLEIVVTNEGKPFQLPPRWSAMLMGTKPDNTALVNGCVVENGYIVYDFESGDQIATCAGRFAVTVWIYDEEGVPVAAPKIWVNVIESGAQQIVESMHEFEVLMRQDAQILALQLKDKAVDEEIDGLKAKDAQVDEEIRGMKEKGTEAISLSKISIPASAWTDEGPFEHKVYTSILPTFLKSAMILYPADDETRRAASKARLSVNTEMEQGAAGAMRIYTIFRSEASEAPSSDMNFIVLTLKDQDNTNSELLEPRIIMAGIDTTAEDIDEALDKAKKDIEETISISITNIPVSRWRDSDPYEATLSMDSISPGEIILLIPEDSKTKKAAAKARLTVTPEPGGEDNRYVYVARSEASKPPAVNLEFIAIRLKDESTTDPRVALIGVDTYGDDIPTSIDLSSLDDGEVVETFSDGTTKTTTIEYDADGNPIKITDGDGNVTVLTW